MALSPTTSRAAAASGAATFIGSSILGASATSIALANIPGTYSALLLVVTLRTDAAALFDVVNVQFNGDTTAGNYDQAFNAAGTTNSTGVTGPQVTAASSSASSFAAYEILVPQYAATTLFKAWSGHGFHDRTTGASLHFAMQPGGIWKSTAAIVSVQIRPATGPNLVAGSSLVVYGLSAS